MSQRWGSIISDWEKKQQNTINTREVCTSCKCHIENGTAFPELRGHSSEFERICNNILIQHMKYNFNILVIFYTT